jgi:hypothetical protein
VSQTSRFFVEPALDAPAEKHDVVRADGGVLSESNRSVGSTTVHDDDCSGKVGVGVPFLSVRLILCPVPLAERRDQTRAS